MPAMMIVEAKCIRLKDVGSVGWIRADTKLCCGGSLLKYTLQDAILCVCYSTVSSTRENAYQPMEESHDPGVRVRDQEF